MKITLLFVITLLTSALLFNSTAIAKKHRFDEKNINSLLILREDLPSYVFEYDLERLYPATYAFYKKLNIINRDKVYSYYLYHPKIKKVRHKIIQLAIGKKRGKTTPAPFSLNQALITIKNKETMGGVETNRMSLSPLSLN